MVNGSAIISWVLIIVAVIISWSATVLGIIQQTEWKWFLAGFSTCLTLVMVAYGVWSIIKIHIRSEVIKRSKEEEPKLLEIARKGVETKKGEKNASKHRKA